MKKQALAFHLSKCFFLLVIIFFADTTVSSGQSGQNAGQSDINAIPGFTIDFSPGLHEWRPVLNKFPLLMVKLGNVDVQSSEKEEAGKEEAGKEESSDFSISRSDLPVRNGYYKIQYTGNGELEYGSCGIRISIQGKDKIEYVPGKNGIPVFTGHTPATVFDFVYYVPDSIDAVSLSVEALKARGNVSFTNIRIFKLEKQYGDSLLQVQKYKIPIVRFEHKPERHPLFPLRTRELLLQDQEIAQARKNIQGINPGNIVFDSIIKIAKNWVTRSDSAICLLLSDARANRAFDVSAKGCPIHGVEIFAKGGFYPWLVDPENPFKIKCPVGGEVYPSNDFTSYYRSGFNVKKDWNTKYVDDGWGWVAPDGERYWFVAYANHWLWFDYIQTALLNLSRAYTLTGDVRYAHKAALMLYVIAKNYPSYDYANQSRYGTLMKLIGRNYVGKLFYNTWETFFVQNYSEAYDNVWKEIDSDYSLQKFISKSGPQIRAFIEANLFEEAFDAYGKNKISGNYGMHQSAILSALLARQPGSLNKRIDSLLYDPGKDQMHTGILYALYNLIFKDGIPMESPEYNFLWVQNLSQVANLVSKSGNAVLYKTPKFKMLLDGPLRIMAIGKYTPGWGDSGSPLGNVIGQDADVYQSAYRFYKDPNYLTWLSRIGKTGLNSYNTYGSFFGSKLPSVPLLSNGRYVNPLPSRLFSGFGMGILNDRKDKNAIALTYGFHVSHYHWDFLNFELWANGQNMMPDLGYPDACNVYVKGIYTWSTNTVSHNTVVVDQGKQNRDMPGKLGDFSAGTFARSTEASVAAYSQASLYQRAMVMVDVDSSQSYTVDFFRVNGGSQHDYSVHGSPGEVKLVSGTWSEKAKGTLAGKDIPLGEIYDDSLKGNKSFMGPFDDYQGSGFQHLFNVQHLDSGKGIIQYQHINDEKAKLRIHILPVTGNTEVFTADAYDKPRAMSNLLKYIIVRRKGEAGQPLKSTFVSVLEPYKSKNYIDDIELLSLKDKWNDSAICLKIKRNDYTDLIICDNGNAVKRINGYAIETDAKKAVLTFDPAGSLSRVFYCQGSFLKVNGKLFSPHSLSATVVKLFPLKKQILIRLKSKEKISGKDVEGKVVFFKTDKTVANTVHKLIAFNEGEALLELSDDFLVGKIKIDSIGQSIIKTNIELPFEPVFINYDLLTPDFSSIGNFKDVKNGIFNMRDLSTKKDLKIGNDLWISDISVGDKFEMNPYFSWEKEKR